MGDAALVTQLEAAAAAAAEAPRPQAQLLEELRDFLMHNGVYQSLLQLFADLDASGLTKVRLADFHRHLTQKLGFGLRDDESGRGSPRCSTPTATARSHTARSSPGCKKRRRPPSLAASAPRAHAPLAARRPGRRSDPILTYLIVFLVLF